MRARFRDRVRKGTISITPAPTSFSPVWIELAGSALFWMLVDSEHLTASHKLQGLPLLPLLTAARDFKV